MSEYLCNGCEYPITPPTHDKPNHCSVCSHITKLSDVAPEYNRDEFEEWFTKLMFADYPCFYRDILRAEKETLWNRFKIVADEYHEEV